MSLFDNLRAQYNGLTGKEPQNTVSSDDVSPPPPPSSSGRVDLDQLNDIWDSLSIQEHTRIMGELPNDQFREFEELRSQTRGQLHLYQEDGTIIPENVGRIWHQLGATEQEEFMREMSGTQQQDFLNYGRSSSGSDVDAFLSNILSPFNPDEYI